jgi:dTDP-4-dehydrorhamnose reductase
MCVSTQQVLDCVCCCRSAVYVYDICEVVKKVISRLTAAAAAASSSTEAGSACQLAGLPHSVYNMGGPERLSRHDMATAIAQHCGHSSKVIKAANSADVQRWVYGARQQSWMLATLVLSCVCICTHP